MLETALKIPATTATTSDLGISRKRKSMDAIYGYSFLLVATIAGWVLSDRKLVDPSEGLGYWLGIVGGSLMLLLLLYPVGKKSSLMRRLGLIKHWFRIHMIFGLVGPLLVLYHCNFTTAATNSTVALYSMLAVAISGIFGRYFYTKVHRGLYGKRASIEGIRDEISDSLENSRGLAVIFPGFIKELHQVSERLLGDQFTRSISMSYALSWTIRYFTVQLRLRRVIKSDLRARAASSNAVRRNAKNLRRTANTYASQQVSLMRQVAQLAFYERVFSLWHIFHMPLFLLLVVSALIHVLAVHMY